MWSLLSGELNSIPIRLARVTPGRNSDEWMPAPSPIICMTAIASPRARPSPSTVAAATPETVVGSTTPRMISQRVAPSAAAPSFSSGGTVRNRSRLSAAMIGSTISVSPSPAVKVLRPVVCGGPNSGMKPSTLCRNGSRCFRANGPSTTTPQSPTITLGIAASISTSGPTTARTGGGAIMLR